MKFIFTSLHKYWPLTSIIQNIIILSSIVTQHSQQHWPTEIRILRCPLGEVFNTATVSETNHISLVADCRAFVIIEFHNELWTGLYVMLCIHTAVCDEEILVQFGPWSNSQLLPTQMPTNLPSPTNWDLVLPASARPDPKLRKHHLMRWKVNQSRFDHIFTNIQTWCFCGYIK